MIDCNWDNPGFDPYRGQSVIQALKNYNLTEGQTDEIKWKINSLKPDAVIYVKRNTIETAYGTASGLRDMHFGSSKTSKHYGNNRKCIGPVVRNNWSFSDNQAALVYCSVGVCVAVPVVCGNISLVDYVPTPREIPNYSQRDYRVNVVPEPSPLAMISLGLLCVLILRKIK